MANSVDFRVKNGLLVASTATIQSTVNATSTATGALQVVGGVGIGGNLYVGNSATILSTLASTATAASNALYIAGGVGIAKSLLVTGEAIFQNNVTFSGTSTYVYSTNTVYTDNIINVHVPVGSTGSNHTWTVDDGKDIGFVFHNYKGADNDSFLGWANNSGYLEWYGTGLETGGTFTNAVYGTFKTGGIILTNTTASNSTSTGALTVAGGVGIGRDLYVGGTIYGAISASGVISTATNLAGGSAGQIPYQNSAGITQYIGTGTNGSLLQMGANTATFVTTANIYVANAVTATNIRGGQLGQIPYQNSAGITQYIGTGTAGSLLQMGGATTATFVTTGNIYVGYAAQAVYSNTATNVAGGTTGAIIYQSGVGVTTNLSIGTSGQILTVNAGATAPQWISLGTITVGNATTATNLAGGLLGQIPYQNSAGITQYIGTGTTGSLLQMGANTATFVTTGSIYVGYANTAANAVTATSAAVAYSLASTSSLQVGFAAAAAQINTLAQPTSSTYYLTFVDSNNATTTAESVYTTGTFIINPATGQVGVNTSFLTTSSKLVVNGRIESMTDPAGEGGQVVLRGRAYRWSIDNYYDAFRLIREDDVTESNGASILTVTSGTNNIVVIGGTSGYSGEKFAVNGGAYINGILTATSIFGTFNGTIGTVSINTATNLAGGTAGAIHYQVSPGVSGFIGAGVTGSLLQMGASTATFVTTSSIYVGYANTAANAVTATSAAVAYSLANTSSLRVGFADAAAQVNTVAQPANATHYLTFVDSNNATSAAESVYTTGTVFLNPSTGQLTAVSIVASQNGTGQNIQIGDDLWIGDINQSNTTRLSGAQDSTQAYLVFGSSNNTSLGRSGNGPLTYGGDFSVNGTTTVTNTTNASSTLTGALQVIGGVGIGGNLYVGGTIFGLTSISGTVSTATNLAGGILGQIPYQNSAGITRYIGTGTTGSILQMGANTATFVTTGSIYVGYANTAANAVTATSAAIAYSLANAGSLTIGSATTATNLAGGLLGQIPYQSAPGVTRFINTGVNGSLLQMGASGTATFVSNSLITVENSRSLLYSSGQGAIPYSGLGANAPNTWLPLGTTGYVLVADGSGDGQPAWAAPSTLTAGSATTATSAATAYALANTGTTYVGNAVTATNIRGGASGSIPYQIAAGVTQFINIGSAGQVLQSNGSTASFVSVGTLSAGTATSVAGGLLGQILYQTAAGVTGFIGTGTAGTILQMGTANTATFVTTGSIYVGYANTAANAVTATSAAVAYSLANAGSLTIGSATTATNLAGGSLGVIPYQTAAGVTGFIGTGAIGSLLQMGATTATFVTTGSIYVGRAAVADSFSGSSSQVNTVAQTANATYFLTFVDANNATAAAETVHTTSSFTINAASGGVRIGGVTTVTNTTNATSTVTGALQVAGGMGVGRDLWVGAGVYAATKSFLIDHPSKPGWKLVHGSLEGPENGVYVRGKVTGSNKIHLPDFWINLVDFDSITVNLTPIGKYQQLFVENIEGLEITIANAQDSDMNFFYTVWAERIDVDKLRVEVN